MSKDDDATGGASVVPFRRRREDEPLSPEDLDVQRAELQVTAPSTDQLARVAGEIALLGQLADSHAAAALSPRTREVYAADWRQWQAWCARYAASPEPPDPQLVRLYLADLAVQVRGDGAPRYKASSIERHLASISHRNYELTGSRGLARDPRVSAVMTGIKRGRRESPVRRRPLLLDDVTRLVETMEHDRWPLGVTSARDTFALLLGFATALRRGEAAALSIDHVAVAPLDGLHVRLGATKTDQEGHGTVLAVPYGSRPTTCVPCARVRWLRLVAASAVGRAAAIRLVLSTGDPNDWAHVCRGVDPGPSLPGGAPLLRPVTKSGGIDTRQLSGAALNQIVKRRTGDAGYDPTPYGYHSLRAGFVTQARRNGADMRSVRRQTRHGSDAMVDVYDREHNPMDGNAVTLLGL